MDLVRHHRRLVGIAVFAFIGIPMLFLFPGSSGMFGGQPVGGADFPVAMAGNTPVTAAEFAQRYNEVRDQRAQRGQPAEAQAMVNDGTVDAILDGLIQEALVAEATKEARVAPDRAYLEKRLRDDPYFQNDAGEFDPGRYNQWVEANKRAGMDWNAIFRGMREDINQAAYLELVGASGRVLEREVREQFERLNTKLAVRVTQIAPAIEPSEDDLREYFEANREQFMTPERRVAEYIALSLEPDMKEVNALIERARGGADFAELAREHSVAPDAAEGGDLGWIAESETLRSYERPLFEMEIGAIRGPISSFMGTHILKLEEERVNDEGLREVRARHIVLRPELPEAEREERRERAEALVREAVGEGVELLTLAADRGLEIQTTPPFSVQSQSIEGIPPRDTFTFRRAALNLPLGEISEVIEGQDNFYIAEIVEIIAPEQQTFDEARAAVERAVINETRQSPEYQQRIADTVVEIAENAKSIEEIGELYPDLQLDVKETDLFGINDTLFNQQVFIDTRQLFTRFVDGEPGDFAGPVYDLMRQPNFVELVSIERPEGEEWEEQYEAERDDIRAQLAAERELEHRVDHMQFMMSQAIDDAMIQKDYDAIFQILGLGEPVAAPLAGDQGDAQAPAETAPSEEPVEPIVLDVDEEPAADGATE